MLPKLTEMQLRVIGVLLEKETTTPEQYPLSLNGLTVGCNQKSNREPVVSYTEAQVQDTLQELRDKRLINDSSGFGSRVTKYQHRFCNTEFGSLKLSEQQRAIICVLFLRGPQTPGELRTRTNRLAEFASVDEVELALEALSDLDSEKLVIKLPREPGKRESRYAHCFKDGEELPTAPSNSDLATIQGDDTAELASRVAVLENKIEEMANEIAQLKSRIE